jgi:hypothetical protein
MIGRQHLATSGPSGSQTPVPATSASATTATTPLRTPVRDQLKINEEDSDVSLESEKERQKEIRYVTSNLSFFCFSNFDSIYFNVFVCCFADFLFLSLSL